MSLKGLEDRLSAIKVDSESNFNAGSFRRETKQMDVPKKNLIKRGQDKMGADQRVKTNNLGTDIKWNPNSKDKNIEDLVSMIMCPQRLHNPTVRQGRVGELYVLYQRTAELNKKYEDTIIDMEIQLNKAKTANSSLTDRLNREFIDNENKTREDLQETVDRLEHTVASKSRLIIEEIERKIIGLKNDHNDSYNKKIGLEMKAYKEISSLINEFEIPRVGIKIPDDIDISEIEPEEIYNIAVENAVTINKLESIGDELSIEEIEEFFKDRNNRIKSTGVITLGTLFTPITFSVAVFNLGKKIMGATKVKKLVKELEKEILTCERLLQLKYKDTKANHEELDLSELENSLYQVEETVKDEYKGQIEESNRRLKEFIEGSKSRSAEYRRKLGIYSEKSQNEYEELVRELEYKKRSIEEERTHIVNTYEDRREEFIRNQIGPTLNEEKLSKDLDELSGIVKDIRKINDLKLLKSLNYSRELDPEEDDPMVILRYEYDQELLERLERFKKDVKVLENEGKTLEYLNGRKEEIERNLDSFSLLRTSGKHIGSNFIEHEIKTKMGVSEEASSSFDNRSIIFVYKTPEEENILVDYIKHITQQLLATTHPEAIKVNIINKSRSNKFNNLQVSLDQFNKKTRKLEKGMPYCKLYSESAEIKDIVTEQLTRLTEHNSSDMVDKTFDEMVIHRRSIGGIVPNYFLNILHRDGMSSELTEVSSESRENGIINYLLISVEELFEVAENDRINKNKKSESIMLNFDLVVEIKRLGNTDMIYITDYRENTIDRINYTIKSKDEVVRIGESLRERALKIVNKKSVTLVKEYIDDVTSGKYWKGSARKQLELHIGYVEGDKSRPYPLIMDEVDNVHMFFGGTTGGGKSNILGVIVNTLKAMYPPSELDVIYFDFKVVEVGIHTKPYKMPHCSAMTGSSQAEYLISLLNYVFQEMEDRYSTMDKYGVQKLSELLDLIDEEIAELRKQGKDTEADKLFNDMPRRMVLIIDEVAQGFKHPDSSVVEVIKEILTKLAEKARAAGIHMILVTQEPSKVPNTLLELCRIRGCTKASPAVSKAVVKNDFCGRLENQFMGFFGTNTSADGDPQANRRYVVPLNGSEPTKILSKIAYEMSENDINRNAVIFNDQEVYTYSAFKRYLRTLGVKLDNLILKGDSSNKATSVLNGSNFFMGETVYFLKEFRPLEINLIRNDMSNIAVVSTNRDDIRNNFETMYKQLAPYADCIPMYCKSIPDYAPVDMFYENTFDKDLFCPMFGKNVISQEEIYRLEEGEQVLEGEKKKILINKQLYKYNAYQVVKGDIFDRFVGNNDSIKMEYYQKDLIKYLKTVIQLRKSDPERYDKRPLYIFGFDFSTHSAIAMNAFPWKEVADAINSANAYGVHLITFSSTISPIDSRQIFSKVMVGNLMVDEQFKDYKNIPSGFCKYVDKLNSGNNRTYKPVKIVDNELTYIEQRKEG